MSEMYSKSEMRCFVDFWDGICFTIPWRGSILSGFTRIQDSLKDYQVILYLFDPVAVGLLGNADPKDRWSTLMSAPHMSTCKSGA